METQYPSARQQPPDTTPSSAGNDYIVPQASSSRPPAHSAPAPHAHPAQQQVQQQHHQLAPPQQQQHTSHTYPHRSYSRVDSQDSHPSTGGAGYDRERSINAAADSRPHLRDLHAAPPPLRRLSAPSVHSAPSSTSSNYLPLPSLAPRSHAPPPAISIPPSGPSRSRYEAPQTAPIVPPSSYGYYPTSRSRVSPGHALTAVPFDLRRSGAPSLAPHYPYSGASSPIGLDDRSLRSPHPPLTAVYSRQPWPPLPPTLEGEERSHSRHYLSSPLGDSYSRPAYTSVPRSPYPPPSRRSPVYIPPPLQFKYSASPEMPPRKKPTSATITSTPATVSSTRSSRRVAESIPAKGNGWTTEHTYDSVGQPKEVIVIQDSSSPVPKKRTRAAAAAAAAAVEKWSNGVNGKKRKVEEEDVKKAPKPKVQRKEPAARPPPAAPATTSSTSAAAAPGQPAWDDTEGHYIVKPDDVVGGRYKIVRLLGQGTFGKVVEARHIESRKRVAIKIIRAVQKYRDASKIEIRVLETLKKNDPTNAYKCIHLMEYFDYRNHPCLVSELYGMSVFDFLKLNQFQPFPERHIQDFALSLLQSVKFLHGLKLIHTDLKPENILLVGNESRLVGPRKAGARSKSILRNTDIRLIDFGSATFENEYHSSVVSTRHYRAPEIILGLPWSYPCDMFSIGCILVEFFTGDALFQTHDNLEHLAMMEVVMGKMPQRMIDRGKTKKPEFFRGSKIDFPNATVSKSSRKFVKGLKSIREIIPPSNASQALFLDLITRLLDFDPDTRIKVDDALKHPYLRQAIAEPP